MATQQNVINDLGALTKIPSKAINTLMNKMSLCIGSEIHDALLNKEEILQLNIGIGILCVNLSDMQCKFLPGKDLKTIIKRSLTEKIDPVEFELEQTLIAKLSNICDEEI